MAVTTNGNVGIGTTIPTDKLTVQTLTDNYGLVQTDGTIAVGTYIGGVSAIEGGWFGTRSNHPLYFFTNNDTAQLTLGTNGDVGIGTTQPVGAKLVVEEDSDGSSIFAIGNVHQLPHKSGFAKAMIYVSTAGTILRCYNGVTAESTGNCGFTVSHPSTGNYTIAFGFPVNDRFGAISAELHIGRFNYGPASTSISVVVRAVNNALVDDAFTLIVH